SDADVRACRYGVRLQRWDHVLECQLVRHEIVGPEKTVGLGEFGHDRPERSVGQALRERLGGGARGRRNAEEEARRRKDENRQPAMRAASHGIILALFSSADHPLATYI